MNAHGPVLIMAGGTGGHVFPALAVADELRQRGISVVWLGTHKGIEARLVPDAGYPVEWLSITGLRGKGIVTLVMAPLRLSLACWQAMRIILRVKPSAVLGMGGFASGPGGLVSWLLRKPLLIHEQNAIPGLTNRLLSRIATVVMQAFPGVFANAVTTGNPVRQSITEIERPESINQPSTEPLKLLVIGGSLGAVYLNEVIPKAIASMSADSRPEVIHQTGVKNLEQAKANYSSVQVNAKVEAFIDDMKTAYQWADLVICRAGAMTIFELASAGIASILVPYPHAVDDHQTENARYLEAVGAAMICQQADLTADWIVERLHEFQNDRPRLQMMGKLARSLAIPDSARTIADQCVAAGGIAL